MVVDHPSSAAIEAIARQIGVLAATPRDVAFGPFRWAASRPPRRKSGNFSHPGTAGASDEYS